jgi:hypothetical protein
LIARLIFYSVDLASFCRSTICKPGAFLAKFVDDFVLYQDTDSGGWYHGMRLRAKRKELLVKLLTELKLGE